MLGLALAGETIFSRVCNLFRDGDLKAVKEQIRAFVQSAETGLEHATDSLRAKACDELYRLQKQGHLIVHAENLKSIDMSRFADTPHQVEDAQRAVRHLADALIKHSPHLAQVVNERIRMRRISPRASIR